MAFAKEYRLHSSGRMIPLLIQKGWRQHTPFFRVHFLSSQREHSQLAVVVSRKIAAKAVMRNRIRRRLQEAIRTVLPGFEQRGKPVLAVFFANEKVLTADFQQLQQSVEEVLNRFAEK